MNTIGRVQQFVEHGFVFNDLLNTIGRVQRFVEHGFVFNDLLNTGSCSTKFHAKNQGVWGKRLIAKIKIFSTPASQHAIELFVRGFHTIGSVKEVLGGNVFYYLFLFFRRAQI